MANDPGFDLMQSHKYFSVYCFNKAWELIDKPGRSREEADEMIRLSMASLWHWTQRDDCKSSNLSVGCWQASRVYALAGRAPEAKHYAELALRHSGEDSPFLLGYAYEALARAEQTAGNTEMAAKYRLEAEKLAVRISDEEDRKLLTNDLQTI
jgi:hypothetical protein